MPPRRTFSTRRARPGTTSSIGRAETPRRAPAEGRACGRDRARSGRLRQIQGRLRPAATGTFGSGWVWLVESGGKLELISTSNAGNPLPWQAQPARHRCLEHAYYLDYQNRRADHVQAVLDRLVNWDVVGERLTA